MSYLATDFLGKRTWRRLERRAVRYHERDLLSQLRSLAATGTEVLDTTMRSRTTGVFSLQLSGRRLVLGGVTPRAARSVVDMARSAVPVRLVQAGRYGRLWWVSLAGDREQVLLASHLHLLDDPGRPQRARMGLPVLSGAY